MIVIPAIDLHEGNVVRLTQGKKENLSLYETDVVKVAKKWFDAGAKRLHLVDLDGAFSGKPKNFEAIAKILEFCQEKEISVQVGGGVRTLKSLDRYLQLGVDQVIVGTKAIESPEFFGEAVAKHPQKILLSLDIRNGEVYAKGWKESAGKTFEEVLSALKPFQLNQAFGLIYTDISRDGTLQGPNLEGLKKILYASDLPVIVAGGISKLEDVRLLKEKVPQLWGIITGKAIYEGTLDLKTAILALE